MKIFVLGDTHGSSLWFQEMCITSQMFECDVILQLGDFGFFPNLGWGQSFLTSVRKSLNTYDQRLVFIDGNHDDHLFLRNQGFVRPDGFKTYNIPYKGDLGDRIQYAPRGHWWEWDGVKFAALGGAYSIDIAQRHEGHNVFANLENITLGQALSVVEGGPVDFLVTHECPAGVDFGSHHILDMSYFPPAKHNREMLAMIVKRLRPSFLVHGHHHTRHSAVVTTPVEHDGELVWSETRIEGFSRDGEGRDAWGIFDTNTVSWLEVKQNV